MQTPKEIEEFDKGQKKVEATARVRTVKLSKNNFDKKWNNKLWNNLNRYDYINVVEIVN